MSPLKSAFLIGALLIAGSAHGSLLQISEGDIGGGNFISISFTAQGSTPAGFTFGTTSPDLESTSFTIAPPAALSATSFGVITSTLGVLVEPGTNQISDRLTFAFTSGLPPSVQGQFVSDNETGSLGVCTAGCIEE